MRKEMIDSMVKECLLLSSSEKKVETIYFGGGTPSLLTTEELNILLNSVTERFSVDKDCEITLEANPDDINEQKLAEWRRAGINRLSLGIQSFYEEDLKWMNRAHNAEQALSSIMLINQADFDNYSADLIFGTPTLTDEKWKENIDRLIVLGVPHISCYALTVEAKTALAKMIVLHKKENIDNEKQANQFLILIDKLEEAGYEHYEISNFAKPGFRSRHNSSYWQGKPYFGIGPSAHSYDGQKRRWNISNNVLYIQAIEKGEVSFEEEILTDAQKQNEFIMISVRTMEGINLNEFSKRFGDAAFARLKTNCKKYLDSRKMILNNNKLILTKEGKLFADGIAADLFD
jgi:oxygen-independent coproporphyrinogen III oxidase